MTSDHPVLAQLRGRLVVSCQAYPGEPMRDPSIMTAVALAALLGGAAGIRAQGLDDVAMIRIKTAAPLIGLVKVDGSDVFITPTVADARAVAAAGADVVALDATARPRPDGQPLAASIDAIHAAGKLAMADCSCLDDARYAVAAGADCVGTTLAGYTPSRPATAGPDFELLTELVTALSVPVLAEGRVRTPADARRCLDAGAYSVVVGTAITHPTRITQGFVAQLEPERSTASAAGRA
jgi:N-acylglucosamine-6-phosphate 2-epimerase